MKTPARLLGAVILSAMLLTTIVAEAETLQVFLHGNRQQLQPQARLLDGAAMLPLRSLSTVLGADVQWEAERKTAVVCKGNTCIEFPAEEGVIVDGYLMVPLRQMAEKMDLTVDWHAQAREVGIRSGVIGMKALPIDLPGVDGHYRRSRFDDRPAVVQVFWSNHCPTIHAYEQRFVKLVEDYKPRNVEFVAIASNCTVKYPADNFDNMKIRARDKGYNFYYVHEESQELARYYGAQRTPDVFLVNPDGYIVYRGRIEDNQNPARVRRHDLREALDELLAGKPISVNNTPPHGCTIKWK